MHLVTQRHANREIKEKKKEEKMKSDASCAGKRRVRRGEENGRGRGKKRSSVFRAEFARRYLVNELIVEITRYNLIATPVKFTS